MNRCVQIIEHINGNWVIWVSIPTKKIGSSVLSSSAPTQSVTPTTDGRRVWHQQTCSSRDTQSRHFDVLETRQLWASALLHPHPSVVILSCIFEYILCHIHIPPLSRLLFSRISKNRETEREAQTAETLSFNDPPLNEYELEMSWNTLVALTGSGELCMSWERERERELMTSNNISSSSEEQKLNEIMLLLLSSTTASRHPLAHISPLAPVEFFSLTLPHSFIHNNKDMTLLHWGWVATEKLLVCLRFLVISLSFVFVHRRCEGEASSMDSSAESSLACGVFTNRFFSSLTHFNSTIFFSNVFLFFWPTLITTLRFNQTHFSPWRARAIAIVWFRYRYRLSSINKFYLTR